MQAWLIDRGAHGVVAMADRDRAALLQRLSTNDVLQLQPGQGAQSALTNHIGRIIDLLLVLVLEEQLLLLTGADRGPEIAAYLRRNIFFMDQARVEDLSAAQGLLELHGADSVALLERLSGQELAALALFDHRPAVIAGVDLRLVRVKPLSGAGWGLLAARGQLQTLSEALLAGGASALDPSAAEVARVEAGLPAGPELNLEYIPLEVGLWDAVSFKKGCYVGQEIIARMESRGRLAKRLMGLRLAALPETLPAPLLVDGKDAGDLTSAALSPRLGPLGLGFVRSAYAEPGTAVVAGGVDATVVELPFEGS